ncbi:MAG: hypothetical protein A2381_07260 [Bdellovibrionales bacterium RIFOXYB1_FULL_37_110]|nr:MAG: hypothetical protein A2181_06680 [Bdellovibrionales bacterium RIFOXYA1_FULL_38_20]OFZ45487.1 MAG: hypothetical protein A2417_18160 [Bdellovibrionales bacterium RIFOXYC1_FULL_37_79]OFZ53584.1 MAG: hypothetical protein A2328_04115 [Bdellovibrionales bacterium RIFOXYB2_FULL_36_6]OFZ60634.1 MAG: hypothetical protein A2381_07260 [Bdellovibrionales bacterium RIFOXYB1_FULL_37_110]OFZ63450.1 MAG: hypothetical protein A2577_06175 [Bdellovibrionales bacterium RIFOXYD1_FULL_36_51]
METNNPTSNLKTKLPMAENHVIDSTFPSKTTSLRPTRSIIPPRSLYRTGIKTTVNPPKDGELFKKEEE